MSLNPFYAKAHASYVTREQHTPRISVHTLCNKDLTSACCFFSSWFCGSNLKAKSASANGHLYITSEETRGIFPLDI